MSLVSKKCEPCRIGTPPLSENEENALLAQLNDDWVIFRAGVHHIKKKFTFKTYLEGIAFVNRIADLAEAEGHHPDMMVRYGSVVVKIYTHKIKGLSENDFILAAKIDTLVIN